MQARVNGGFNPRSPALVHFRAMKKTILAPLLFLATLGGCVSTADWSEAPGRAVYVDDWRDYGTPYGAPSGWWGRDMVSINIFYGALSPYGSWASHPRYGRVFLPGGIGSGWHPYSVGYWREHPRFGRSWYSREPFGWATYHYGRWGRDSRYGWFWVPDTRFGPSWADWRQSGGYASWSPLPPPGWAASGWGNDWWLTAPVGQVWRPGLHRHVRPGWQDRPRPGIGNVVRPERPDRPQAGRPRYPSVEGTHPRSGNPRVGNPRVGNQESRQPRTQRERVPGQRATPDRVRSGTGTRAGQEGRAPQAAARPPGNRPMVTAPSTRPASPVISAPRAPRPEPAARPQAPRQRDPAPRTVEP